MSLSFSTAIRFTKKTFPTSSGTITFIVVSLLDDYSYMYGEYQYTNGFLQMSVVSSMYIIMI